MGLSTFPKVLYSKINLGFKGLTLRSQGFCSTLSIQWKSSGKLCDDDRNLYKNPQISWQHILRPQLHTYRNTRDGACNDNTDT